GRVVSRVGARDRNTIDGDGLCRTNAFVRKAGTSVAGGEAIPSHAVVGEVHRRASGAVINFIHTAGRHAQRAGGNVRGSAGGGVKGVIGRVSPRHADAADTHRLDGAD